MAYRHIRRREHSGLSPRKKDKLAAELHHQKAQDRCSECGGRWGQHYQACSRSARSRHLAREYESSLE
jgi:hypothetical protein